ncbi:MAG TPA: hypothetical protein VFO60_06840 [Candidatus Dormibacteraeota bacterium]|nr:hypothetical protein [Candidatus Dormibacteraeota bacterium]
MDEGAIQVLATLRRRADEDFHAPPDEREPGRHTADLAALGLRVTITRSRYPNRPDGTDMYAVTISTVAVDRPPGEVAVRRVLSACFGDAAVAAQSRPGGERVRMFRIAAGAGGA